jgi:hypothetical protein
VVSGGDCRWQIGDWTATSTAEGDDGHEDEKEWRRRYPVHPAVILSGAVAAPLPPSVAVAVILSILSIPVRAVAVSPCPAVAVILCIRP